MKRMKRVLALGMAVLMCMGLTACGKDFDAAGYTKSVLDANYHAQYDKYAEYRGISESDAKKEVTEGMRTQIESAFSGMDVSDEMMDKYIEVADKAYDLADFTVKDAKKQDDDSYVVFIYPSGNQKIKSQSLYARNELVDERLKEHFILYSWEDLCKDLIAILPPNTIREYYEKEFYNKYLGY